MIFDVIIQLSTFTTDYLAGIFVVYTHPNFVLKDLKGLKNGLGKFIFY